MSDYLTVESENPLTAKHYEAKHIRDLVESLGALPEGGVVIFKVQHAPQTQQEAVQQARDLMATPQWEKFKTRMEER